MTKTANVLVDGTLTGKKTYKVKLNLVVREVPGEFRDRAGGLRPHGRLPG
jgi:hypothetical protein